MQKVSSYLGRIPVLSIGHFMAMSLVTLLVVALSPFISTGVLAGGALVYLALEGAVLYVRHRKLTQTYSGWRDVMPCYLSVQDRDLRIIETNDLFEQDFGGDIGEFCFKAYKRRAAPCPNCPVLKTFADGQNHSGEETVITRDGHEARVLVSSAPLRDESGRVTAVVEMSTNITELQSLRQELEWSRKHFERLFNSVPCYISIHDREFKIIESNDLFRKDFGECRGQHCYLAYKGSREICRDCPVEKTFSDGEVHSSEETVTTRNGRQVNLIVYSMPIQDEKGSIWAVMEVSTDISEVKRLQRNLAMVGLAVSGMAHRIKNILMGLEGGIYVVNTGFELNDKSMVDEGWGMVQRNVVRVSAIAKDLLRASKEREPQPEEGVSVLQIVREVLGLYRQKAASEGIELVIDAGDDALLGRFDPKGIHTLVANLTTNAIDACRFDTLAVDKKHRIVLRCSRDEAGAAVVEVADNGPGIPRDTGDKIFESFFSTKGQEGTGLGLLMVQQVVEEHGGKISYTSEEGKGTTFKAVLPCLSDRSQAVISPAGPVEDPPQGQAPDVSL